MQKSNEVWMVFENLAGKVLMFIRKSDRWHFVNHFSLYKIGYYKCVNCTQ